MKRFISAIALCASLLVLLLLFLFPPISVTAAKENILIKLLSLPAPPPPNPLVNGAKRDEKFYDKNNPPSDNAPIEELIDYWTHQAQNYRGELNYRARPSDRTVERLASEMAKQPELASQILSILPDNKTTIDTIKELYDRADSEDGIDKGQRSQFKEWLRLHSPHFSGDLARASQGIKDTAGYVGPNDERTLLALTRHDFDKANPVITQLYSDSSQPVSKSLATWALYQRALETGSLGDIERYRSELMRIVENRSLPDGARDMANDALTHGPDFPGRDDWTFSLFEDETLVNMPRYSMLTTLVMYSPPEKYVPKMIALLEKTSNPLVRAAAVHNLVTALNGNPSVEMQREIIQSMLPWLEDPKWASDSGWLNDTRSLLIRKLTEHKIPESVPGLIKLLDEKVEKTSVKQAIQDGLMKLGLSGIDVSVSDGEVTLTGTVAKDRLADVMKVAMEADVKRVNNKLNITNGAPAANVSRSAANSVRPVGPPVFSFPYRQSAIAALAKQKDGRAVPALRRVLSEVDIYERYSVISAILECGGFSIPEQMEALDAAVKRIPDADDAVMPANIAAVTKVLFGRVDKPISPAEISIILGAQISQASEISDELARAIVDRIEVLDTKDQRMATNYRNLILKWKNPLFSVLLLLDLKRDAADTAMIVQLLSRRKELRETLSADVYNLQTGKPVAVGVAACILEDAMGFDAILESSDAETKTAMLACARLIRAPLPVAKVAENLKAESQILQTAAERYLESEDSIQARAYVLARHPNKAKILGATSAFFVEGATEENVPFLWNLFQSVGNDSLYNGWAGSGNDDEIKAVEKRLQDEVKKDDSLLGIYSYDSNYIRIYKDRAIFSWDEDESRYRERPLTQYEFEDIKSYLTTNKVDELAPFLTCGGEYCGAKELLMLGRNGGRRVYTNTGGYGPGARSTSAFFAGLDKYFADLKLTRAALKYGLSRDIPGLEILLASDDLHAETVWAQGSDLRVAASDVSVRKKFKADLENLYSETSEEADSGEEDQLPRRAALLVAINKRQYDGYGWYKVADGSVAGSAAQPPQVEFVPLRDALSVQPSGEQWKARASDVEIRTSEEGLFKAVRGKLTKLHKGYYQHPVITPNSRWVIASKSDPEVGEGVVRIDLVTNREFAVEIPGYGQPVPTAYISTLNKFLVVRNDRYNYEGEYFAGEEDAAPDDADPSGMMLVDPATGAVQPIAGEFRPLAQQTFRALQQTSKPNEFWAAIYDPQKKETQVGIYDIKAFGFKPVLRIPKINFNSMSMWVDEPAGKVYFVYRGHLLALPLHSPLPDRTK
ncbi:MAG: BON domain-containing protein [Chloracidobacterium sp.]|nr:BON domain-containing protein [Chloracidobacterium sp.]